MITLKRSLPMMASVALVLALHTAAQAETTIVVSTIDDDIASNGNCTLREAIIAANTETAVDNCPAGSGEDTIVVARGLYLLTRTGPGENGAHTGDLDVLSTMTILGAGADLTMIDGGSLEDPFADRVFHVLTNGSLTISGLTVQGGHCRSGGGVLNSGRLVVQDSSIVGNVTSDRFFSCWTTTAGGAGIYNRGDLTILHSGIAGNVALGFEGYGDADVPGGGVVNTQLARIELSTLSGNWAAVGGALFNQGALQIGDSWITANGARFWGSGFENDGVATVTRTTFSGNIESSIVNGGWQGRVSRLSLENATVTGNESYRLGGTIVNVAGELKITASTVGDNVAQGIIGYSGTTVLLMNSIVAGNGDRDCNGVMTSLGYNLDGDATCVLNQQGDLPFSNPLLESLADNGGPVPTRALLPGSPALDRIPASRCRVATDQRGALRTAGPCDMGAYELDGTFFVQSEP